MAVATLTSLRTNPTKTRPQRLLVAAKGRELVPAIRRPGIFAVARVHRLLVPVAYGINSHSLNSEIDEIFPGHLCAPLAQREVVLFRAPLIAVARNPDLRGRRASH